MSETAPASQPTAPAPGPDGPPAIATWTAAEVGTSQLLPLSPRTGEPTRVWSIWVGAVASLLATTVTGIATLWVFWDAVFRFSQASWLTGQVPSDGGATPMVLAVVAITGIAIVIGAATAITGYYAYDGRGWTRWAALVTLALSAMALMLNPLAWAAIGLAAIAAIALWLPGSRRYFASWRAVRHHDPVFSPPVGQVTYGPLPRFR